MIVKVMRGDPVNKEVEIDTDSVIHAGAVEGSGGRVEMEDGEWFAFNSVEWAQWGSALADEANFEQDKGIET